MFHWLKEGPLCTKAAKINAWHSHHTLLKSILLLHVKLTIRLFFVWFNRLANVSAFGYTIATHSKSFGNMSCLQGQLRERGLEGKPVVLWHYVSVCACSQVCVFCLEIWLLGRENIVSLPPPPPSKVGTVCYWGQVLEHRDNWRVGNVTVTWVLSRVLGPLPWFCSDGVLSQIVKWRINAIQWKFR